eukprot:9502781-Pyramimonas_sp.AAC.1
MGDEDSLEVRDNRQGRRNGSRLNLRQVLSSVKLVQRNLPDLSILHSMLRTQIIPDIATRSTSRT